jgi:CheY-like chemotaxis protein
MNGYEAARAIHADRHTRGIPIIAADCADFERRALKAGFIAVLEKPWKPEALLEILTKVLIRHDESTRAA